MGVERREGLGRGIEIIGMIDIRVCVGKVREGSGDFEMFCNDIGGVDLED